MTFKIGSSEALVASSQSAPQAMAGAPCSAAPLLALAPISLLLSSGAVAADRAKLALLGTLLAIFFLFAGKVWFPGGAEQFVEYAEAIVRGTTLVGNLWQRDAGYPLLLLLSGYSWLHSLIPIFLIQAGFAIVLPLLVYEGIRHLSPTAAFYAGLASLVSLNPFLFMKMIHHDQSYIFFSMLTLCLLLIFVQTKRLRFLYLFTAVAIFASITRPAGNALFPLFLIVSYIAVRGKARHYVACLAIFAALMVGYSWHRHVIFDLTDAHKTPSYTGAQIFYNPYLNSLDYGITLSPREVGSSFALALTRLRDQLEPDPKDSEFMRFHYLGSPAAQEFAEANMFPLTPDELVAETLKRPNYEYYTLICEANDDSVLLSAAFEIVRAQPAMILRYVSRNFFHFVFDPGYSHSRYNFNPFRPVGLVFFPADGPVAGNLSVLSAQAVREIKFDSTWPRPAVVEWLLYTTQRVWWHLYGTMITVLAYLMTATWVVGIAGLAGFERWWSKRKSPSATKAAGAPALSGALLTSIVIASLVFLYNAAVTAVFAEPDFRYRQMVDLQAILIAGLGLASVPYWLNVALGPKLAATVAKRWDQAAQLTYAYDIWRCRPARQLAVLVIGVAAVGLAAWTLFMLGNTLT